MGLSGSRFFLLLGAVALAACSAGADSNTFGGDDTTVTPGGPTCADADGDGISDEDEGAADKTDTDGDGTPDYQDTDSDGDGVADSVERGIGEKCDPPSDSDGDGVPDFRDTDSDGDGVPDSSDDLDDLDGDGIPNYQDLDDDGDGLSDAYEMGPDPLNPIDTDGDGTPDYHDFDSDDDTILDGNEGNGDQDQDGTPNFRDLDSDGDCIPDRIEAGHSDPSVPPADTDSDGIPDYLDIDSDNDGVPDGEEDLNCNGIAEPGESSPTNADTDGDGVTDLVEHAAGTDPTNPADNPQAHGDFFFLVPYQKPPTPENDTLDFSTKITNVDVVFSMDTTGSMSGPISNLKSQVAAMANTLSADIDNVGLSIAEFRDFPSQGGRPFLLRHRVMTTKTAAGMASIQAAVNLYTAGGGGDGPETSWEALYQIATGAGGVDMVPFNPATAPPTTIPAGESIGTIGGVGFRAGALPIVVQITDANAQTVGSHTAAEAISAYNALGGKFIGISTTTSSTTRNDLNVCATGTDSRVPPTAWDADRPAGCGVGQCCTGSNGAGEAVDGDGLCRLSFVTGSTVSSTVVSAIKALTNYASLDIGALATDSATDAGDPTNLIDAVASFVERLETNTVNGAPCTPGLPVEDRIGSDTINDTFPKVKPGTQVCFDVIPKQNTTVKPTDKPQMFTAQITVRGNDVTDLETRTVYFLVPPELPQVIIY